MKKAILVLITIWVSIFSAQGQTWETIGSGVADFLLSNPKTADKMKPEQQVALNIIGNLLNTAGQRKHELNVAEAGRVQMNFNTNSGQQIQLVMDTDGSVYALSNGIIYPISQNIVNEAKEFVLNQQSGYMNYLRNNSENNVSTKNVLMLPDFNVNSLKHKWEESIQQYEFEKISLNRKMKIKDFLNSYNFKITDVYFYTKKRGFISLNGILPGYSAPIFTDKRIEKNNFKVKSWSGLAYVTDGWLTGRFLFQKVPKQQARGLFTAKWVNDLNQNRMYEFDEFQDLRRNYYQNEPFLIACGLHYKSIYYVEMTVIDHMSGEVVMTQELNSSRKDIDHGFFKFDSNHFEPGIYIYSLSFKSSDSNREIERLSDKFQILALEQPKDNISDENIKNTNDSNISSSKEKMINDLIQMLKEGKISEETFKVSMKALEEK